MLLQRTLLARVNECEKQLGEHRRTIETCARSTEQQQLQMDLSALVARMNAGTEEAAKKACAHDWLSRGGELSTGG